MFYRGHKCLQHRRIFAALDGLTIAVKSDPIKRILEIGTANGGFTHLLCDHDISSHANVYTFDIETYARVPERAEMIVTDCFREPQKIIDLCVRPDRTLLLCDGGAKEREVNTFCAFLKPGDIVMCHDYVKTPSLLQDVELFDEWTLKKSYGWNNFESQLQNVEVALTTNNFVPFCERTMQLAFWGCFVRQ
jgi:hypothetical protein